ncbi:MAG: primosomal protein N' [Gammaproteobacteria bacterium]|nr:primosomal protein N' [Gammaproteobacteria bacterium]
MGLILAVAVPGPFRSPLDYLPAPGATPPAIGTRVKVPLGRRTVVGVVLGLNSDSRLDPAKLRPIIDSLDASPILDADILELARWAADYYHHPIGEVIARCLPTRHRRPDATTSRRVRAWQITAAGLACDLAQFERAPAKARALQHLRAASTAVTAAQLTALGIRSGILKQLEALDLVASKTEVVPDGLPATGEALALNPGQTEAVAAIIEGLDNFGVYLLDGVTGSGKTEVYLQTMATALAAGRQVLMLVPEIGLTPQAEERLRQRFGEAVATLHSGMSDVARLRAFDRVRQGGARVLIGTRSAIFTPMPELGLIVVDEEHDESYKQQDGLRYSARDLALIRARNRNVAVVLGSATPSLESLHNARSGRYRHLHLPSRAGNAVPPTLRLIDLRRYPAAEGFSEPLQQAMAETLAAGNQVLVFLNRRGFAPVLRCSDCGWIADCPRCDARMTVHSRPGGLRCHHCGTARPLPPRCPDCGAPEPMPVGHGTQRTEAVLKQRFPGLPVVRIDRDSTASQHALAAALERIQTGAPAILVGTQMLAKGHHFPAVTLVAVLDADGGLFSADFRGSERLAQQVLQVAGRAGRAERPGQVLIQTLQPEHPFWPPILDQNYQAFALPALAERAETGLPPCAHLALLRAEAPARDATWAFLEAAAGRLAAAEHSVAVLGPIPALRERLAGRYRAQLLLQSSERSSLHALLRQRLPELDALPQSRRVRWSLDVDPIDLY